MEIQLDEHAYQKLIDENIEALNKYMPEHSLEKKHTIEVLKWSVQQIYHRASAKHLNDASALPIPDVSGLLPDEEEIRTPIQDALYATRHFLTDECTELADGILLYLKDAGFKVVRQ